MKALADVLDDCVDAMRAGQTPEDCAAEWPEYASELLPLLSTVNILATLEQVHVALTPPNAGVLGVYSDGEQDVLPLWASVPQQR